MTDWFTQNGMKANPDKYQVIIFGQKNDLPVNVEIKGNIIKCEQKVKLLGINVDSSLSFNKHINLLGCLYESRETN